MPQTTPRWQMAAISKNRKNLNISATDLFTDFDKIWHGDSSANKISQLRKSKLVAYTILKMSKIVYLRNRSAGHCQLIKSSDFKNPR